MKGANWLAIATAFVGAFLLILGVAAAWAFREIDSIVAPDIGPYSSGADVAKLRSLGPHLYLTASEGLIFGTIAVISSIGLALRQQWAARVLLPSSVLLALSACILLAMDPGAWDSQGVLIAYCVLYWLYLRSLSRDRKQP